MRWPVSSALLVIVAWGPFAGGEAPQTWTPLSLDTCNVGAFLAAHPESDGRGVVIAILDTGVDPSIPGLDRTPDGTVKVIDVQDFSGEGDTDVHRVQRDPESGTLIEYDEDGAAIPYALPALDNLDARRFWFGWLEEKKFVNSEVSDLNDNGATDDRFPFFVTAGEADGDDDALFFIDADLDRSFADETALRNYKVAHDTFTLARRAPEKQNVPLTFAVNVFPRQSKVVFHFDDGAHGTHVAGIAAGYRINGQDGFNGVAPGAKVISLKIGQNAIGGVSTTDAKKRALEYAARFAREQNVPVVCNLSYGVESTIEGNSAIDRVVNEHLQKNPYLIFCTSGGNEGPGLSTIGTPSAAAAAITSAALLAPDSGRDVQGFNMNAPVVTVFSSRGGETAKPDIATPGWSASTVPNWIEKGDYWSGTSMASPYTAGLCALLVSDAKARGSQARVRAVDVKRALQLSATPPAGASPLDCGFGIPDVAKAAEVLQKLVVAAEDDPVIGYDVSTPCAQGYKGRAAAAYWRSTYLPEERQVFTISPIFAPGIDAAARAAFTRRFTLRSLTPWCKLPQESFYLHHAQDAAVYVEYDTAQLTEPGVYTGVVEAVAGELVAFRLLSTIVVPHRFTGEADHTRVFHDQTVTGWSPQRYFLAVPPGASAMHVTLRAPEGRASKASVERIFDPRGFHFRSRAKQLDTEAGQREVAWHVTDDLVPGVWEVDVVADRPDKTWPFELAVSFDGLHVDPGVITECEDAEDQPSGELTVTNLFERPLAALAEGRIEGFRMHKEDQFKGLRDELTYSLALGAEYSAVRIHLELAPEAFAETTDIGVSVLDADGEAVFDSAFENHELSATVKHPAPGTEAALTLRIHAGFAVSDDKRETAITVDVDRLLADAVNLEVTRDGEARINFVPGVPIVVGFEATQSLPKAPAGTNPVGYLSFKERGSGREALRVPIALE